MHNIAIGHIGGHARRVANARRCPNATANIGQRPLARLDKVDKIIIVDRYNNVSACARQHSAVADVSARRMSCR